MKMYVLGTGCPHCKQLTEIAKEAASELGIEYTLEKVTDINKIMSYGVMLTPALVVDGKVLCSGKVPTLNEMKKELEELKEKQLRDRLKKSTQQSKEGKIESRGSFAQYVEGC